MDGDYGAHRLVNPSSSTVQYTNTFVLLVTISGK